MLKKIRQVNMRNALIASLAREGVHIAPDKMDHALMWLADGDTRPDNMPESITIGGVVLAWPRGRETRVPGVDERNRFNTALKHVESNELLTDEHNVRLYREVYEAMTDDLNNDAALALPRLTHREITQAQVLVEAEIVTPIPLVIEHVVPEDTHVNRLDSLLADLQAVIATLNTEVTPA